MPVSVLDAPLGPGVRAGFTTRAGGVSADAWAGLNLAGHVGDDPAAVRRNRRAVEDWVGAPVQFAEQVHGVDVAVVGAPGLTTYDDPARAGGRTDVTAEPRCDAMVTAEAGRALGVLVADCVPVLLADPAAGIVAVAHAGRRGLVGGVLQRVLAAMSAAGADLAAVRAAVGPAAGACCYEVPEQLCAEVSAVLPAAAARTRWGTPSLDLRGAAARLLTDSGLAAVEVVGPCTIDDERFYSYRRAKVTGRFAGVVRAPGAAGA